MPQKTAFIVLFELESDILRAISGTAIDFKPQTGLQNKELLGTAKFWHGTQEVPLEFGQNVNTPKEEIDHDLWAEYQTGFGFGPNAMGPTHPFSVKECALSMLEKKTGHVVGERGKKILLVMKIKNENTIFLAEKDMATGQISYGPKTDEWRDKIPNPIFGNHFPCIEQ